MLVANIRRALRYQCSENAEKPLRKFSANAHGLLKTSPGVHSTLRLQAARLAGSRLQAVAIIPYTRPGDNPSAAVWCGVGGVRTAPDDADTAAMSRPTPSPSNSSMGALWSPEGPTQVATRTLRWRATTPSQATGWRPTGSTPPATTSFYRDSGNDTWSVARATAPCSGAREPMCVTAGRRSRGTQPRGRRWHGRTIAPRRDHWPRRRRVGVHASYLPPTCTGR
jgi:hypothetical protein